MWLIYGGYEAKDTVIPFWSGYQSLIAVKHSSRTVVGYAPIVDATPSDMSTLYTVMEKCTEMSHALGQSFSVQTMDQQLYCIAKKVMWHFPDEFKNHTMRLGGFHTHCCFISSIGQFWGDVGLRNILVDSVCMHLPLLIKCCLESNTNLLYVVLHDVFFSSGVRMYSWKQWKETSENVNS